MVSISKFIGLLSCSFLLSVGLSNIASSADEITTAPSVKMISDSVGDSKPGKTIKGEVVRIEGDNYFLSKRRMEKLCECMLTLQLKKDQHKRLNREIMLWRKWTTRVTRFRF